MRLPLHLVLRISSKTRESTKPRLGKQIGPVFPAVADALPDSVSAYAQPETQCMVSENEPPSSENSIFGVQVPGGSAAKARDDAAANTRRWSFMGLTFELSRVRRPQAVARRLERRVRSQVHRRTFCMSMSVGATALLVACPGGTSTKPRRSARRIDLVFARSETMIKRRTLKSVATM